MRLEPDEESADGGKQPLRTGLTTGSCATAAACAAACALFSGKDMHDGPDGVEITLPKGQTVTIPIAYCRFVDDATTTVRRTAIAGVVKDAGDDPDVTHGAVVFVSLSLCATEGVRFEAGPGVGTVTRAGLALPIGEPAINPVPRMMIRTHLDRVAAQHGYPGGFVVQVGVEGGADIALKTMNPRLGILGGLSILGTTGIVRPFSCAAYIASIHQGIDVARANGQIHLAACTGNTSEWVARERYGLPDMALIEMGDFAGAVLKHIRRTGQADAVVLPLPDRPGIQSIGAAPLHRLSLVGGFGKFSKLAAGHLDLHSKQSSVDLGRLAQWSGAALGMCEGEDASIAAPSRVAAVQAAILNANTSLEAHAIAHAAGIALGDIVCRKALAYVREVIGAQRVALDVIAIDRRGEVIGQASEDMHADR
ncbi:cobalt-precorrin-6A synthase [Robbsia andropogonis]|uniref:Cobalt-precorrin-5B C(1)-methyltransferase n=1 Tax=Robbsia andropogonis TaxID=28092 RepID=A0A0F5JWD1_9BURK|nr:cobalt-precorrin-5B (C(1))-methyltransferase [Robbsia andropogonis]KKB62143.1 cobalt-precorrin-6A synthase [Robbsia andropogonis]MCP1119579.1 cobalt-precorrin-5B (C(1))-methyltransferase [Robbsia andropogonis]MCP1129562.1 cobalt-precorrin-5B (C(1))-methyltransferase [Robbsia andropogonis]